MKSTFKIFPVVAVGSLGGALMLPVPVNAQEAPRAGSWEFILPVVYSPSADFDGQGGSSASVNSDMSTGFGFGYNVNNHLQVNGMFNWNYRSYNANIIQNNGTVRKASGTLNSSTLAVNAAYYFSPSGTTPFLTAGLGSTFLDSNVPSGPPQTGCWYDPWYGKICDTYTPTKTQTAVSYAGGVGMRFALNRAFSLQASYNRSWVDFSNAKPQFDSLKLDLVFRM